MRRSSQLTSLALVVLVVAHPSRAFSPASILSHRSLRTLPTPFNKPLVRPTKRFTHSIEKEEPQSVPAATFSLIKAIVGSGVLAMPAGLAVATDAPKAVIPATIFVFFMACLSAYSFYMIGRMCHADGAESLPELWSKDIGKGSGVVTLSILIFTLGAALTYSIVLGDSFSSLAQTFGLQGWLASRQASILLVTLTALWPLCNLGNLAALAPFSVVGVVGVLVTCLFMILRWAQPSGPYRLPSGSLLASLAPSCIPVFGTKSIRNMLSPSSLVLASMCNTAFMAHYSAGDFYHVLGNKDSSQQNVLGKFKRLVLYGFSSVFAINAAILSFGFLTFGGNCNGIVLNNYSTLDIGATICRLLMALCVIGGFPFLIHASRQTFFDLKDNDEKVTKQQRLNVTRGLVALITSLALILPDAGVVVSFNGAVMGSAIIYIIPAILYLKSTRLQLDSGALQLTNKVRLERNMSRFLVGFGTMSAILGGAVTILTKYFPHVLGS